MKTKKYNFAIYMTAMFFIISCSHSKLQSKILTRKYQNQVKEHIESLLKKTNEDMLLGIQIIEPISGKIIYEKNPHILFNPASVQKLIITAASLYYLGQNFAYNTSLLVTDYQSQKDSIQDLILKGSGDPLFKDMHLYKMCEELVKMNIKHISGNIIIDDTVFDRVSYGKGWMWDDLNLGYSAPISAMNINRNHFHLSLSPAKLLNHKAVIKTFPISAYVKIDSEVITNKIINPIPKLISFNSKDSNDNQDNLLNLHPVDIGLIYHNKYILEGGIKLNEKHMNLKYNVANPPLFAASILKQKISELGIKFNGKILLASSPNEAKQIANHISMPLNMMLMELNKRSDNHGYECLLKTIGTKKFEQQGSFNSGIKAAVDFLKNQVNIDTKNIIVSDASGLSRYNLVSASSLNKILVYAYNNFDLAPEFMTTLPVAGQEGTLINRFKNNHSQKKVRAKTGSMTGMSALAGYCAIENNSVLVFSILINSFSSNKKLYKELEENILSLLIKDDKKSIG